MIKTGGSKWQILSQPSPSKILPSSHSSIPLLYPSPQTVVQLLFHTIQGWYQPSQRQLISHGYKVQVDEQPS